jgi:hypothetical protein
MEMFMEPSRLGGACARRVALIFFAARARLYRVGSMNCRAPRRQEAVSPLNFERHQDVTA